MKYLTESEYLTGRVDNQIDWYNNKCAWNKKWFYRLKIGETILALLVPFLTGYLSETTIGLKIAIGLIGLLVAAIANLITLLKFQEIWIEYRTTAEALVQEKFLFTARAAIYTGADAFPIFVERIESILNKEHSNWSSFIKVKEKDKTAEEDKSDNAIEKAE